MSDQFFTLDEYGKFYLAELELSEENPLVKHIILVIDAIHPIKDLMSTRVYNIIYDYQRFVVKRVQPYEAYISLAMQDYKFEYIPQYVGWFSHKNNSYLISQNIDMVSLIAVAKFCDEAFLIATVRKVICWLIKSNFVHGDLPDNVFISISTYEPVIIDFEYSQLESDAPAKWTRDAIRLLTRIGALRSLKCFKMWIDQINAQPEEFSKAMLLEPNVNSINSQQTK